jgi:hypothetical protein
MPTFYPLAAPTAVSSGHLPTLRAPNSGLKSSDSINARLWQNRYIAWQTRESVYRQRLEAERLNLFGGEPGDDPGLCDKMMEVFEGMDWIDTMQ